MGGDQKDASLYDAIAEEMTDLELSGDTYALNVKKLALAEVCPDPEEATYLATDAKEEFTKMDDKLMQAKALLQLAKLAVSGCQTSGANMAARLKEAKELANEALALARTLGNKELEGDAWHCFAEASLKSEAVEDAVRSAKKALQLFQDQGSKKLAGVEMLSLARMQKEQMQLVEASTYASEGAKIFAALELPTLEARCRSELLGCHLLQDKIDDAMQLSQQTLDAGKSRSSSFLQASANLMFSSCYLRAEDTPQALHYAEESLTGFRAVDAKAEEGNALNAVAAVYAKAGKMTEAKNAATSAMVIFTELGDASAAASSLLLSNSFFLEADSGAGLTAAQTARDSFRAQGDAYHEGMALMQVAVAAAFQGRSNKAVMAAEQASDIFRSSGSKTNEAAAMEILYDIYLSAKEYDLAIDSAKKARLCLKSAQARYAEVQILKKIAEAYSSKEESKEALRVSQEALNLAKDLNNQKSQVVLLNLMAQIASQGLVNDVNSGKVPPDPKDKTFQDVSGRASGFAREAVNMARKVSGHPAKDPQVLLANALYTSAQISSMMAKGQDALTATTEALAIFGDIGDDEMLGWSSVLAADCHGSLGQQDLAVQQGEAALKAFQGLGQRDGVAAAKATIDRYKPKQVVMQSFDGGAGAASGAVMEVGAVGRPDLDVVKNRLKDIAAEIVGDSDGIDTDSPLMDSGMDSLSSLDFRSKLSKEFSLNMPSTMVFEYPSISKLADFLVEAVEDAVAEGKLGAADIKRLQ